MSRLPVAFVGHGAPLLAVEDARAEALDRWARTLPRPEAILVLSAHWEAPLALGQTGRHDVLVYDFGRGLPDGLRAWKHQPPIRTVRLNPSQPQESLMSKVHELAVRVVKPGKDELFTRRRAAFIQKLKSQKGVLADREFESFFALPGMDERPVFIGMTTYDTLSTVNWIQMNPMVMLKFMPFFMTMSLKAYVFMEQTDGPDFDLDTLGATPGSVVHIAVRKPNGTPDDEHLASQAAFYELLRARDGVGRHFEFKAVKGFDAAGVTIGITEYADDEAMAAAFEALSEHEAFLAYTRTCDTVASQFARSTTND